MTTLFACRRLIRPERPLVRPPAMMMLAVFLVAFIGVASPFALGSGEAASNIRPSNSPLFQKPRSLASKMASTVAPTERKSSIRKFLRSLNPAGGKKDGRWKGGETKATIPARLLFSYVAPLLDLASERNLDVNDAFEVADHHKMNHSVSTLADTYEIVRRKARKRIEEQKLNGPDGAKNSQSLLLLQALLQNQRGMILSTGVMRLVNTAVQAFPSVLVARLLRLMEAGEALPASKALTAALTLVTVLVIKMIIENQFFHYVVTMSTQTRGALEGLIFDKSLRLPGGGSGVLSKRDKDKAKRALGSGGVLNLMQSDASIIETAAMQLHTIWDGPLQIFVYTALLYKYLGPSVFWGIGVLLTVIPINSITLRVLDRLSRFENEAKDARTKRTTESITNMKLLKVQGWEKRFADDIRGHRDDELQRHKTRGLVRALNSAISNAVPALVLVVTLTAYARTGRPIVASTIFTAISLFNQLRFPLFFYPMLIDSLANGKNALRRISSYLSSEEITPYVRKLPAPNGGSIEMENGNFLWATSEAAPKEGEVASPAVPALCDVNLKVKPGEVVAVVGPVGSGKSALIKALLGELAPVPRMAIDQNVPSKEISGEGMMEKPSVVMKGNVAYCSQEAWLPKGTIRDAILFGREYDETRYMEAIRDAGLDKDMIGNASGADSKAAASSGVLSHETDVGEGGSSLSGGQKARVALARALYSGDDTKVFLLDDCLSALDASVGSLVFERLTTRLKASKAATVLVTNDPSLPRRCDRVILMGQTGYQAGSSCSTVIDVGTYDQLIARGHNLKSFDAEETSTMEDMKPQLKLQQEQARSEPTNFKEIDVRRENTVRVVGGYTVLANRTDQSCHADPDCQEIDMQNYPDYMADRVVPQAPDGDVSDDDYSRASILMHPEESAIEIKQSAAPKVATNVTADATDMSAASLEPSRGRTTKLVSADDTMSVEAVPFSTYVSYLKAIRSPTLIVTMLGAFITANFAQFFQQYTVAKWTQLSRADAMATALGGQYMRQLVYAAGVVSVFLWIRSYLTMQVCVRASEFYHSRMLSSVFKAPMSFFDATPSGQILSRFGKELETIDRALPDSFASVIFCALQIFSSALALAGAITPGMAIPLVLVGSLYGKTMKIFRPAARDMKRTETKTRSPIFTHFGEALRGTEVIRSVPGAAHTWSSKHRTLSDTNLSVFSTVKALDRWLSCTLEALGNFMVFMSALASVMLTRTGRLTPGSAGWGLTQSLAITGLMAWAVRNLTYLESHMMSVMRVSELTDIDSEEAVVPKGISPKSKKSKTPRMPKELAEAGEALRPLFPEGKALNLTLAPLNEAALVADGWPWRGNVQFKNVSMRYNPSSPLVLKEVTLSVPPGTTLGVVGRTGSGKSSLLLTLFRIIEIEKGGAITIDGVDVRSVSIQTLREKLSIIPQDPTLFAGTIGYNLDATGKASPEDMWEALEAASPELAAQFKESGGLDFPVSEGGSNLSLGQRQLICLARALLRKAKILVMDEATSSVDSGTDQQVQDTIRQQFVEKGVTVITVAHRLDTVLGYDRIAVLGDGELLEYGAPPELLKLRNGELRRLVDADRLNKLKGGQPAMVVR